jgi:hypothetical protein
MNLSIFLQVAFYALLTYSATSMGAITLAAHQVHPLTHGMSICEGMYLCKNTLTKFFMLLICEGYA